MPNTGPKKGGIIVAIIIILLIIIYALYIRSKDEGQYGTPGNIMFIVVIFIFFMILLYGFYKLLST